MVKRLTKIDAMLLRMILKSKSQFLAVVMILIVGIAIFAALSMTSINMRHTLQAYYEENHFADLFIRTGAVPLEKAERLAKIPGVKKVSGRTSADVPMITEDENQRVNIRIVTFPEDPEALCRSTVIEGKDSGLDDREVLLIQQFAEARDLHPGDTIAVQIGGIRYDLRIAAVVANPEYIYLMENAQSMMPDNESFGVCYVSEKFGSQAMGLSGSCNEFLLSLEPGVDLDRVIDDAEKELYRYGVKETTKKQDQLSNNMIEQELKQLDAMCSLLPFLFLAVAALILIMMLARMVKRDRLKIGILKAVGYRNSQVMMHYVKYAMCTGLLGGAFGSAVGMGLAGALTQNYLMFFNIPLLRINFYYSYIAIAMLLSFVICALAGTIGARGVAKIAPADAMRAEPPKAGKRIFLEKIPFLWKRLSFSQKMVGKNIFRNTKRTIFVLSGVILTYGMMAFTTSMPDAVKDIMDKHFKEFQRMDYNINFVRPVDKRDLPDFTKIIDVDYMEGKIEYPFELANGNKKQAVNVVGLSKDTKFYFFEDRDGDAVDVPERGILLSENLAHFLGLQKGDTVQVRS